MRLGTVILIAVSVGAASVAVGQPAPQLFRVEHDTYGCANPRATRALANQDDPRHADPNWVSFVMDDGHCVAVTPRSQWRLVFRDGDLAFLTYAGTTAAAASFYIRLDDLSELVQTAVDAAAPPASQVEPARPVITAVPLAPLSQSKSQASAEAARPPKGYASQPSESSKSEASSPAPARPAPAVVVAPSSMPVQGTSQSGGSSGLLVAFGIVALVWLVGHGKRAKKAKPPPRQPSRPATTRPEPTARLRPLTWIRGGHPIPIGGISVPGHMIYVGDPLIGSAPPHCLIDPKLPVAPRGPDTVGSRMPYWPSYSAVSPASRLAYLQWLPDGRKNPAACIGYVFLFFYGLERRAFVDRTDAKEVAELVAEVRRLLSIYGGNGSFRGYATGFVSAVELRAILEANLDLGRHEAALDGPAHHMPIVLKLAIATKVAAGQPLPFGLAIAGLMGLPADAFTMDERVLEQARPQFLHLMRRRFDDACPLGYKLADRRGPRLELRHRCATAGLTVDLAPRTRGGQLPDPSALDWGKLAAMASQVAAQLEGFASLRQRHPERARTLSGLAALPEGFAAEALGPAAIGALRWLENLPKPISRVDFADLAAHALGERDAKWTLRHHRAVHEALAATRYGLEPHPEDGSVPISGATPMYVFPDESARRDRTPSYTAAALGADVVDAVSRADPATAGDVRAGWLADVGSRIPLSDPELLRLDARLRSLSHSAPPTASRIAKRSVGVSAADRATVARLAAEAAAAAGAAAKGQVALLERIYDEFGLERSGLYSAIHAPSPGRMPEPPASRPVVAPPAQGPASNATANPTPAVGQERPIAVPAATEPVLVSRASPETTHRIPPPPPSPSLPSADAPATPTAPPPAKVMAPAAGVLDPERIKRIQAETRRVSSVLEPIFAQDEDSLPVAPAPAASEGSFAGLDERHATLLRLLSTRGAWSRVEFEVAARQVGLFPDGAMETLNEWAFDHLDAALLEDGDPVVLNLEMLLGR